MTKTLGISAAAGLLLAIAAASPAAAKTCLSSYHLDANGHCQPNNPIPAREICPKGYYGHPASNRKGYRCKPYP
jgi:hypothetical protein